MVFKIEQLPDGSQHFVSNEPFKFINGDEIPSLELRFETYGQLNSNKDNVIVIHHSLSMSHHVQSTQANPNKGWWEGMIVKGRVLDPSKFFIICINNLGSCFGSSGPVSINTINNKKYVTDFPNTTFVDIVNSQHLLLESLGIKSIYAMISYSLGAMISMTWAAAFPEQIQHLVLGSTCYKAYPTNIANRALQKKIICLDPKWTNGEYEQASDLDGFKVARELGHLTYRDSAELNERFTDKKGQESILSYLDYNAKKFISYFDANCYLYMLHAMDEHQVVEYFSQQALTQIKAKILIIAIDTDRLFPVYQQKELYDVLSESNCQVNFIEHASLFGHDTFVIEKDAINHNLELFLK